MRLKVKYYIGMYEWLGGYQTAEKNDCRQLQLVFACYVFLHTERVIKRQVEQQKKKDEAD